MADQEYTVTDRCGLMDFLLQTLTHKSRNNIKSLLTHKEVMVDGRIVSQHDYALKAGQTVRIVRSAERGQKPKDAVKIIYEDPDLIVINKPAGLLSIAADDKAALTAYNQVTDYMRRTTPKGRIFIVHRLDRDTSGVLLFAKNERIKLALQDNWDTLVSERSYVAVIEGHLQEKSGRIRSWLKETKTLLMYSSHQAGDGLEAITNYQVLSENEGYSLVAVQLETGRKNQIRVHMKELGHPVAGDSKYGARTNPMKRLGLHANKLVLKHPFTDEQLCFETEIPGKFKNMFKL